MIKESSTLESVMDKETDQYERVIAYFGSQANAAKALGISSAAVAQWKIKAIPPQRAIQIEVLSQGKIKALELIPSLK